MNFSLPKISLKASNSSQFSSKSATIWNPDGRQHFPLMISGLTLIEVDHSNGLETFSIAPSP